MVCKFSEQGTTPKVLTRKFPESYRNLICVTKTLLASDAVRRSPLEYRAALRGDRGVARACPTVAGCCRQVLGGQGLGPVPLASGGGRTPGYRSAGASGPEVPPLQVVATGAWGILQAVTVRGRPYLVTKTLLASGGRT